MAPNSRPPFTSSDFIHFLRSNGIKHIRSAIHHSSSNGQVERLLQMLKRSLKASERDGRSLSHHLAEFLLSYWTMPHATTGCSPGELFLKRPFRTKFDLLRRFMKDLVEIKQMVHKQHHDQRTKLQCLFPGSPVMVMNYRSDIMWIPGLCLGSWDQSHIVLI